MSDEDQGTFTPPRPAIPSRAKGDVPLPTADVYADVAKVARAKKPRKPREARSKPKRLPGPKQKIQSRPFPKTKRKMR